MNKLNLYGYAKKYIPLYFIAFIAVTLSTWLDMIAPMIVQHIVDDVLVAHKMELLKGLLLGILAIGVGRCICQYTKEFSCDFAGSKIAQEVRINVFQKIQSLSANFFDSINSGELMSRVTNDVDRIWDIFAFMGILMLEVILRTGITMFYLFRLNWKLALVPIFGMIGAGIIAVRMEQKLDEVYGDISQENSELNNTAAENLAGVRTVKAFAREDFEKNKFHKHNQKYYELNIKQSTIFVHYNPIVNAISYLMPVISMIFGGMAVMVSNGTIPADQANPIVEKLGRFFCIGEKMTIGQLMALIQYVGGMMWPMGMLGWLTNGFSSGRASIKRLNKIYEQNPQITDQSDLNEIEDREIHSAIFTSADITGNISFENVTYRIGERDILKNISFDIGAGQTLGIMGATGAGKTTIVNLLKRMYDITDGSIKIDGVDIRKLPLASLRKSISIVAQDIFLFSDTIEGNVQLGEKERMGSYEVKAALDKSQASGFVNKMSDAEHTVIGERGIGLSGGQKQRITIARALARKTPILILDDSTSALDTETEQEIQKQLNELSGMTKIIIGHRISSVRKADKIIVLNNGEIAECGTHEELLKLDGLYKETYDSQY